MRSSKYLEADFLPHPRPERAMKMSFAPGVSPGPSFEFGFGIKTIVEDYNGLKLKPHQTIVVEIKDGEEIVSTDIPSSFARTIAAKLVEFADAIEGKKEIAA